MFIGMILFGYMMYEIEVNLEVLLLLVFMVVGIYFMKDLFMYLFIKLVIKVCNKLILFLLFIFVFVFLLVFFDVLMVVVVIISVGLGFYFIYYKVVLGKEFYFDYDYISDDELGSYDLEDFRVFLCNFMMYLVVGIVFGGVMIMVGEL